MIIRITLKDPDGVYESIQAAAEESLRAVEGLEEEESDSLIEARHERIAESLKPWIEFGEYVRLEIDTEKKTATVITNQ